MAAGGRGGNSQVERDGVCGVRSRTTRGVTGAVIAAETGGAARKGFPDGGLDAGYQTPSKRFKYNGMWLKYHIDLKQPLEQPLDHL